MIDVPTTTLTAEQHTAVVRHKIPRADIKKMMGPAIGAVIATAIATGCASRPGPVADVLCAGASATPISITGEFHVVYGDGPTFHLVWSGRSAALQFTATGAGATDSLLVLARRRTLITGHAVVDTSIICVATVSAVTEGSR